MEPGSWAPPGGHLHYGETPEECALRELTEETGLIGKFAVAGPWTNDFFSDEDKHYISLYMVVTEFTGNLSVKEKDKALNWEWFPFTSLPANLFLSLSNLLKNNPELLIHLQKVSNQ